jgi:hypothetical protein
MLPSPTEQLMVAKRKVVREDQVAVFNVIYLEASVLTQAALCVLFAGIFLPSAFEARTNVTCDPWPLTVATL